MEKEQASDALRKFKPGFEHYANAEGAGGEYDP